MYQKVTQEADGRLLGWYLVESKYEGAEPDFDVLTEYAVYPHLCPLGCETGHYIAEYLPTTYCFGAYKTLEEALEGVRNKINSKMELSKTLEEAGAKFGEIVSKNSLDERYRDKVIEKKLLTNEQLREKYAVARMNTTARLNRAYYSRLLDH